MITRYPIERRRATPVEPAPGVRLYVHSDLIPGKMLPAPLAWTLPAPHSTPHQAAMLAAEAVVILATGPAGGG